MKVTTTYLGIRKIEVEFSKEEVRRILVDHILSGEKFSKDVRSTAFDDSVEGDGFVVTLLYEDQVSTGKEEV